MFCPQRPLVLAVECYHTSPSYSHTDPPLLGPLHRYGEAKHKLEEQDSVTVVQLLELLLHGTRDMHSLPTWGDVCVELAHSPCDQVGQQFYSFK